MKILILGSSGFLGSNLFKYLQDINLDISIANRKQVPNYKGKQYDISDIENIKDEFDVVYFLSAYIPGKNVLEQNLSVNLDLAQAVANRFKDSRVIFSSSVSVYKPSSFSIVEEDPKFPTTPYGMSKLDSEKILLNNCNNLVILRFSSLFGPGMKTNTFLPQIINSALLNNKINIYNPNRLQDYLYIDDAVHMISRVYGSRVTGIFNAVNGTSYSNFEMAATISHILPNCIIEDYGGTDISYSYSKDKWNSVFKTNNTSMYKALEKTISKYKI